MAAARVSLRAFLGQAKTCLRDAIGNKNKHVTLVIGNESADLDSITSSIVYAYLRSFSSTTPQTPATLHIPLLNIPKADIALRPELLALLPHADLASDHLITLDDLPDLRSISQDLPPDATRWILVDHNALQGQLGAIYASRVVGTIDHHADEGKVPGDTGSEPRIITTSGSCTSLIVNYCKDSWEAMSSNPATLSAGASEDEPTTTDRASVCSWDAQVAQLALASILIDTHNLESEDKVTVHDKEAVAFLVSKIDQCPTVGSGFEQAAFFARIDQAKKDLDSLWLVDILRKDYKQWSEGSTTIGISSVVQPLSFLENKADKESQPSASHALLTAAKDFSKDRSLAVYSIMTTYQAEDGQFSRQLLVAAMNDDGTKAVERFIETCKHQLELEDIGTETVDGACYHVWQQKCLSASRKQVAPMLREAASKG